MKYIQCQHCEKKYSVNDKLCSAAGKQIRCKHCQQTFKIVIQNDHNLTAQQTKKKVETGKKKINLQVIISAVLGFTLICISIGAYLFFYKPELFNSVEQQKPQPIIPHDLVNPMTTHPIAVKPSQSSSSKKIKPQPNIAMTAQNMTPILPEANHQSQVCKNTAAKYWLRTRLLTTVNLDTDTYMTLLNMNLKQAAEIRELCRDATLIARITEAARTGNKPPWIKTTIKLQIASQFNASQIKN